MFTARQTKEITVEMRNEIGVLHNLSKLVAEKGVSILGLQGSVQDGRAVIRMVTDDNLRATDALRAKNYLPLEVDAVMVEIPHKPGMLRMLAEKLARAGLDVDHLYATAGSGEARCTVVLSCTDNGRAVVELNR